MNIDELCVLLETNCNVIENKIQLVVNFDLEILANYYIDYIKTEDDMTEDTNFQFKKMNIVFDPIPQLEPYLDSEFLQEIYEYLKDNNKGYNILFNKIKENSKYENSITIDKDLIIVMMDYYLDYILETIG